jgi:hypothetical protein
MSTDSIDRSIVGPPSIELPRGVAAGGLPEPARPVEPDLDRLEATGFDLSIGTIHLVVEEPPRPAVPPRAPQPSGQPMGPSDRLRRHYLRPR